MTEPTDAQAAALALPGDDWPAARRRAKRLLAAVRECRPCPHCDLAECGRIGLRRGWIDDGAELCPYCAYDQDACYEELAEELRRTY